MTPARPARLALGVLFASTALVALPAAASAALTVTLDSSAIDGSQVYYGQGNTITASIDYPEAPHTALRFTVTGANPFPSNPGTVMTDGAGHAEVAWSADATGGDVITVFDDANSNSMADDANQDSKSAQTFEGRLINAGGAAISSIAVGPDLWCQATYTGDTRPEFYGGYSASCNTYIRTGGSLYSISPTSQTPVTGNGSSGAPYVVTTTGTVGSTGLDVTHVVTYVTGQDTYRTDVTVTDTSGSAQTATIAQYADCYLGNSDSGFGYFDPTSGGTFCTKTANNSPADRLEGFIPLNAGFTRMEGGYSTVYSWIYSHDTFPDTCDCSIPSAEDNGMGLAWQVTVPANGSVTRSFLTGFSPVGTIPEGNNAGDPYGGYVPQPPYQPPVQSEAASQNVVEAPLETPPPPPTLGTGNAEPVSGVVLVRLPGSLVYVAIETLTNLPAGTLIDATRGVVNLTVPSDTLGGTQTGEFSFGKFRFSTHPAKDDPTKLITDITMAGGKWNVCAAGNEAGAASLRSWAEIARRRVVRYLLAKAHGNFNVVGRDAAGLERGTEWQTMDTCKSTEVRVIDGTVLVTDFVLNKTVVVKGGNTYAAHDNGVSQHQRKRKRR